LGQFADAIDFILHERTARGGAQVGGSQLFGLGWEHLKLTVVAVVLAAAVALPVGVWLGHRRKGTFVVASAANVGRAVPSIAIIFLFFAFFGAGFTNVVLALALLAIPPILTNADAGVRAVDPDVVDAARGMGLTGRQVAWHVELPLGLPLVLGGLRTATVNVLATATIAPFAGVVTLGDPIINPSSYGDEGRLGAAIVVAVLAVVVEVGLGALQRALTPAGLKLSQSKRNGRFPTMRRLALFAFAALCSVFVLAACGGSDNKGSGGAAATTTDTTAQSAAITKNPDNAKVTLTVGSKNFTEQKVLGEIYAQAFGAAGYGVKRQLNLGDEQTALKALKGGQISGYPEYTGTILLSFLNTKASDLPTDEQDAYTKAKDGMATQGIDAYAPTPFTSSNEVGVLKSKAAELGLQKISDLKPKASQLTLYGSPECRTRRDCLLGLQQVYGLKFKKFVPVDIDQRHEVLKNGDADLSIVFTTDPQIKRDNEVLLEDDKGMFPPYNSTFLVKRSTADTAGPDLQKTIDAVNKNLTADVMQELNARVDLDKETPAQAASAYLKQYKLTQ
jgi:glycine betaine/choline ABC-type transport system substrate-binding protein/ABC-type proline/glycine betaine transport system permease subunit